MKRTLFVLVAVLYVALLVGAGQTTKTEVEWQEDVQPVVKPEIIWEGVGSSAITSTDSGTMLFDTDSGILTWDEADATSNKVSCDRGAFVLVHGYDDAECFSSIDDMRTWLDGHKISDVHGVFERRMKTLKRTATTEWRQVEDTKIVWSIEER